MVTVAACGAPGCVALEFCEDCAPDYTHDAAGTWPGCGHVKCGRLELLGHEEEEDLLPPGSAEACPKCVALAAASAAAGAAAAAASEAATAASAQAVLRAADAPHVQSCLNVVHSAELLNFLNDWLRKQDPAPTPPVVDLTGLGKRKK